MDKKVKIRQWIKLCMRKLMLPLIYWCYCIRYPKMDQQLAVFADAHHREFPEDMRLIKEKMEEKGYRTQELVHDFSDTSAQDSLRAILTFMQYFAQAKYVFLCDYYLPAVSVRKRSQTKVIQLWHACGAYKKFGYDAQEDLVSVKEPDLFKNFDLVAVSAESCRKVYADAFHIPIERVQALGVSRTDRYYSDRFMQECREEFFSLYPEAKGKKIILWAPTFRKNAGEAQVLGIKEIGEAAQALSPEWYIIKKVHPHTEKKISASNCSIPTERLYAVADLLITDYSSVIFDFALTRKPVLIYAPDRDAYESSRGFYLDLDQLPAQIVTESGKLIQMVREKEYGISQEKYEKFLEDHLKMCDGSATQRIVDHVLQL